MSDRLTWRRVERHWAAGPYVVRYDPAPRRYTVYRDGEMLAVCMWLREAMNFAERDWHRTRPDAG